MAKTLLLSALFYCWAVIFCGSTMRPAQADEAVLAALAQQRSEIEKQFRKQLTTTAQKCDSLKLPQQAAITRGWSIKRDPRRQYLFTPAGKDALQPDQNASQNLRFWFRKFSQQRHAYAGQLFDLAERYAAAGDAATSYQLLHELLREDPEHAQARRILGYTKSRSDGWQTRDSRPLAKRMKVRQGRYDWPSGSYWRIDSTHFRISTNHSAQAGLQMAQELEKLHQLLQRSDIVLAQQ